MKKCVKCDAELDDNATVCPNCGETVGQLIPAAEDKDRPLLDRMIKFLRFEHFAWKLKGILCLVCTIIMIAGGLIIMLCGTGIGVMSLVRAAGAPEQQQSGRMEIDPSSGFSFEIDKDGQILINNAPLQRGEPQNADPYSVFLAFGVLFIIYSIYFITMGLIVYLPHAIINLKLLKKVEYYENTLYSDVSIARKRCTSVGMIVFAAIFNRMALIFIIINFVKTKKNAKAFDRIEAAQKGEIK